MGCAWEGLLNFYQKKTARCCFCMYKWDKSEFNGNNYSIKGVITYLASHKVRD